MKYFIYIFILSSFCLTVFSQDNSTATDTGRVFLLNMVERDGVELPELEIKEVTIVAASSRNDKKSEKAARSRWAQYTRLVYNIKKTYPYSRIVKERMDMVNDTLMVLQTDKERRQYMKEFEKSIFNEFEGDMRKMTITQGQILIKLVDRETQNTSYQLIKDYRGAFSAAFWQGVAKIFGTNLKAVYDPYGEDAMMEMIISDIEAGLL